MFKLTINLLFLVSIKNRLASAAMAMIWKGYNTQKIMVSYREETSMMKLFLLERTLPQCIILNAESLAAVSGSK